MAQAKDVMSEEQSIASPQPSGGFWKDVRSAVVGRQQYDFTEGAIGRAIMLLAIPMVLEMAMESLFGIVNVFWVSNLGADSVAAVGITESLLTLVFGIAIGLSMATTAMVARRTGEKDIKGASIAAVQAIAIGICLSLPIGALGFFFTHKLFELMGASAEIIKVGGGYGAIILGGNLVIFLLFLNNAVFRGAGDASIAMRALWIANLINLVLDPCLIFGVGPFPRLGVTGSAIATTIGRGLGVVFQLWALSSGRGRVWVKLNQARTAEKRDEPAGARSAPTAHRVSAWSHFSCGVMQLFGLYFVLGFFSLQWLAPYLTYTWMYEDDYERYEAVLGALGALTLLYPIMLGVSILVK